MTDKGLFNEGVFFKLTPDISSSDKQYFKIYTEDPTNGNKVTITQANLSF